MQVILKQDVKDVGEKGKIVNVADGFARNFLFPRKLAIPVNKSTIKTFNTEKSDREHKEQRELEKAKEKAEQLSKVKFIIHAKAGDEGKLFGSVTAQDVVDAVKKQFDYEISKRKLQMEDHIKFLGKYAAKYKLANKVIADINFEVVEEKKGE